MAYCFSENSAGASPECILLPSQRIRLNYARSTQDGILVQDMTKPDESTKLYKISTYDANSDLSKAMFDFTIQEAPSGWVQVWCYEDSDRAFLEAPSHGAPRWSDGCQIF